MMIRQLCILPILLICNYVQAYTILIDPGHGGDDIGAKKNFPNPLNHRENIEVLEKYLTLDLSKKIFHELQNEFTVFLTRSIDRTMTLEERSNLAEKVNADLYVSVHFNAGPNPESHGLETYYLDNHENAAVKKIEKVENAHLSGQDLVANKILIDMLIERTAPHSKLLASLVHQELKRTVSGPYKMANRGIRPGLFYVLALSKRPAILLDAGFLTNPREVKKLLDPRFQQQYAKAVARGIHAFFLRKKK